MLIEPDGRGGWKVIDYAFPESLFVKDYDKHKNIESLVSFIRRHPELEEIKFTQVSKNVKKLAEYFPGDNWVHDKTEDTFTKSSVYFKKILKKQIAQVCEEGNLVIGRNLAGEVLFTTDASLWAENKPEFGRRYIIDESACLGSSRKGPPGESLLDVFRQAGRLSPSRNKGRHRSKSRSSRSRSPRGK